MPRKPLMMIRVFDLGFRIIGYVDAEVAGLAERKITPGKPFDIELFKTLEEMAAAVMALAPSVDSEATYQVVTARVETPVFYRPGKYTEGEAAMPPDAIIHNLVLLQYPDNLWEYPGWYERN